jgi:hypothetical protein
MNLLKSTDVQVCNSLLTVDLSGPIVATIVSGKSDLVYCDMCGVEADRRDKYCRICGRSINRPSTLWRTRVKLTSPLASASQRLTRDSQTEPEISPEQPLRRAEALTTEEPEKAQTKIEELPRVETLDMVEKSPAPESQTVTQSTSRPANDGQVEDDVTSRTELTKEPIGRLSILWRTRVKLTSPLASARRRLARGARAKPQVSEEPIEEREELHEVVEKPHSIEKTLAPTSRPTESVPELVSGGQVENDMIEKSPVMECQTVRPSTWRSAGDFLVENDVISRTGATKSIEKTFTTNTPVVPSYHPTLIAKSGIPLTEDLAQPSGPQAAKDFQTPGAVPEELLVKIRELEKEKETLLAKVWKGRKRPSVLAGYAMGGLGALSLIFSVVFASTVLAFIGLGLVFWGALLLFIRPRKYVKSELMDSTALSSLKTIDRILTSLGYTEKGVYIPSHNPEKTVVFIPSEPSKSVPHADQIEKETFVKDPKGVVMVPPGLALANLFERELGVEFSKCSLETLSKRLPKILIEDLEMVQDFEMHVDGDKVRIKLVESIYSDFCSQLSASTRVCSSLGCPMCSAMACVLAQATRKPVAFEEDNFSRGRHSVESSYRILEG